ncbi:hypothetical protein COLO4_06828 [Corchorus olitorius]|uniref:Uncharacterized protein n=1 Tax=Corchorus olitorius TaxID=93759 RepID=A0A1R3KLT0_9ROSI|nr:hypothetical protein COLO4_06828 [Corchorus olitorius]
MAVAKESNAHNHCVHNTKYYHNIDSYSSHLGIPCP